MGELRMMKIDCQSHIFPLEYVDILMEVNSFLKSDDTFIPLRTEQIDDQVYQVSYSGWQSFRLDLNVYDPVAKLKSMDEAGVDLAIVSINIPNPCLLPDRLSVAGARTINDYITNLIQDKPDRFAGFASLPWNLPAAAIEEIDRIAKLGFRGAMLYPHIAGQKLESPQFEPVYTYLEACNLPIIFHPTVPAWGEAIQDFSMIPMIGFQIDTSFGLLRLILSGIFERHPRLKVVLPHAGGVLPYMMGRIDHQTEIMGRATDHISQPVSTYLRQNVYFDLVSPSAESIAFAHRFIGGDRLLFASDDPWVKPTVFTQLVDQMQITAGERQQIYSQNAQKLFGL